MPQVVRPYRGVSADDRRTERRARLVEAALDVAGDEGVAGTTMKAVCARAGLTERYYYESFNSRDELLVAVVAPILTELRQGIEAELAASPPDLLTRARAVAGVLVEVLTGDPRKARMFIESVSSDGLRDLQSEAVNAYAALIADEVRTLYRLGPEHEGRLAIASLVLVGGTTQAVISWLAGTIDLPRDELIDELASLTVAAAETVAER